MFDKEFKSLLNKDKISRITEIDASEGSGQVDFELTLENGSGLTCEVYVDVETEDDHIIEDFGLGNETHESSCFKFKITEVEGLTFWNKNGDEKEVSEEFKKRIIKYIKTGK